jgi:hypothetical protein
MRKFDKSKNIKKANLLAEQRHLESKGLIKEEEYNIDSIKAQLGSDVSDEEMSNVMSALAMDDKKVTESEGDKYYLKDKNNLDNMLYDVSRVMLSYVGTDKPKDQAIANDNRVIIQRLLDNGKLVEYLNQRIPSTGLHTVGYGADDKDPFLSKGKGIWANDEEAMINYMKQNYMNPDEYKIIGSDYFKKKNNLNEVGRDTSPILGKARVQFIEDLEDLGFDIDKIKFIKSDNGQMFFKAIGTDEGLAQNRLDNSKYPTISSGKAINDGKGNSNLVFKIEK